MVVCVWSLRFHCAAVERDCLAISLSCAKICCDPWRSYNRFFSYKPSHPFWENVWSFNVVPKQLVPIGNVIFIELVCRSMSLL